MVDLGGTCLPWATTLCEGSVGTEGDDVPPASAPGACCSWLITLPNPACRWASVRSEICQALATWSDADHRSDGTKGVNGHRSGCAEPSTRKF